MQNSKKIRVAVLYGGRSTEHEVSVSSALNVIAHLDRSRFEVVAIKIDKQGNWFLENQVSGLPDLSTAATTQKWFAPVWLKEPEAIFKREVTVGGARSAPLFDVIFPMMHGTFSEDGTIQGLLELADIPYVGCGVLASAIGMDKDVARRLVMQAGIPTVPYIAVKKDHWLLEAAAIQAAACKQFTLPFFVKPANQGSSIGVSKVKTLADLTPAVEKAFHFDTKILIEQAIPAMELEIGLLESLEKGAPPYASLVAEARPRDEYYTYAAKYTEGGVEILVPAPITDSIHEKVKTFAQQIFTILEAEGMARIDFFLDKNTQEIYFNEINTIPGFTPTSGYPQIMTASGLSLSELLTCLIELARNRFEQKKALERNYSVS